MKHSVKAAAILLLLFLLAQFIGIAVLQQYVDVSQSAEQGKIVFAELPIGERPPLEEDTSFLTIAAAVLIGTGLAFLLMRFKLIWLWKIWFFAALLLTILVALAAFLPTIIALVISLVFTTWRIIRPNFWVQTGTELFVYPGLAAIFAPLFSLFSVSILLLLIALYDAYAVWKSKHMIALAKSQAKAKIFAGLLVPYLEKEKKVMSKYEGNIEIGGEQNEEQQKGQRRKKDSIRTAVLGGGDVAFPLLFTGVIFKEFGLWQSLLIPLFAALALGILFWKAEEKKFYPAMPFIAAGCFVGLGVVWLITTLI